MGGLPMHATELLGSVLDRGGQHRTATCSGHCADCVLPGSALIQRHLNYLEQMRLEVYELRSSRRSTLEAEIRVAQQEAFISKLKLSCRSRAL